MTEIFNNLEKKDRILLAAVDTGEYDVLTSLDELEELTNTAGGEVIVRGNSKTSVF